MEPIVEELGDLAQQAVTEVAKDGSNWAAIILLIVVFGALLIVGFLVYMWQQSHVRRIAVRSDEHRSESIERMKQLQMNHERELHFRDSMNGRYDETLNKVNVTLGSVNEAWRQSNQIHEGTRRALENNTELLAKFVPTLPKRNSSRKSQGMNE